MIITDAAAATESWLSYSNFKWEVNFHYDQDWYEHIIRDCSQSFYFAWSYHVVKDLILDDENIYDAKSDQTQNNQNSDSDQQKLEQSESDSENYFADHVDILDLKTKIC